MFSSLSRRRVIALVVLTCLLLITLDRNGNPVIDRLRSAVATVLSPLDTATEAMLAWINGFYASAPGFVLAPPGMPPEAVQQFASDTPMEAATPPAPWLKSTSG